MTASPLPYDGLSSHLVGGLPFDTDNSGFSLSIREVIAVRVPCACRVPRCALALGSESWLQYARPDYDCERLSRYENATVKGPL